MPNGHGVPLGCFVCKQYQKGEPNPLKGYCHRHNTEVHMDLACADFDNAVNDATHKTPLTEGILYVFVDVTGRGYPPPSTELVSLAKISEYRDWSDGERKQARGVAQEQANAIFERRE